MNGIDISRWQKDIQLSRVPCDFVIVKATQGTGYVSPTYKQQITSAEALGKYLGVYHYASSGGAAAEAEHFLQTVADYIGKAILVLDWEGDQNANFNNPLYALDFLNYVKSKTGITPFIYMSKSVCRQYKWDASFPLWCAQYRNQQPSGYQAQPWTDTKGFGVWRSPKIFQYSSKGQLDGYSGNLDLDLAYMDGAEWLSYAQGKVIVKEPEDHGSFDLPIIRRGSSGKAVKLWQVILGFKGSDIDGLFGIITQEETRQFQIEHHLDPDGVVGPVTWKAGMESVWQSV